MLVGHTKFSPDWCFGLLKQRYRRCVVNCLDDLVGVVESSANVNTVQLVGDQEGETRVPTYDWCGYFKPHFKKLNNITKYHHFKFTSTEKGVSVKQLADAKEINITILKSPSHHFSTSTLPDIVTPPGLSDERKVYLYEKIREYVADEVKDIVCPRPSCSFSTRQNHIQKNHLGQKRPESALNVAATVTIVAPATNNTPGYKLLITFTSCVYTLTRSPTQLYSSHLHTRSVWCYTKYTLKSNLITYYSRNSSTYDKAFQLAFVMKILVAVS